MNMKQVNEAVAECNKRFMNRVDELKIRADGHPPMFAGSAESGAVKRASMDLSRVLVKLR